VEDPCLSFHRRLIRRTGLEPVPLPVDDDGIDVSRLSHLHVGAVLSSDRRIELLDWARASAAFAATYEMLQEPN
jgi:GntR family transcriptional regulator/MocR family aminotransferase